MATTGLLGACSAGTDYRRPEPVASQPYVAAPAVAERNAATTADLARWWQGFDDPLLSDLVDEAIASNLDIAQALARVTQARAGLNAATAAMLPSGSIAANATAVHASAETPIGSLQAMAGNGPNNEQYQANVGASWEVDIFGGLGRSREAALADYRATQADVVATRISIAAATADSYVMVRGLQARLAVAREQVDTQTRLVATIRLQYEKGIAAELQLRQAEGALAQVEATVPPLEAGLDAALNALDVLLAVQPGTNRARLAKVRPIPHAPAIADIGGPADLIRRRPDLIAAERRLAASHARIGAAIAEYYPKFSLSGLLGTATGTPGNLFTGNANLAEGMLGLRWRLFDFGRVDAEIKSARGANAQALAAYRLSVLRATQDVEDAFSQLVRRETQQATLGRGESALTRAREASYAAYRGGVISLIEVLDADSRLLGTRDARVQAQTETARAAIASFRALGGGWTPAAAGDAARSDSE